MEREKDTAIETPYGKICMLLDGIEQGFTFRCIAPNRFFPDVDAVYRIKYDYVSDGKTHLLSFILLNSKVIGEPETGERLESTAFYSEGGKLSLGCTASFGELPDYDCDFDGNLISNGIEIYISPTTKSQTFEFGVCWLLKCTEENEVQTWYGADPSVYDGIYRYR